MRSKRKVSLAELASHDSKESAWLCIDNVVYDVTKFAKRHPGGDIIYKYAGRSDSTEVFRAMHDVRVWKRLNALRIGELRPDDRVEPTKVTRDFRKLAQSVYESGMYDTSYSFFALKIGLVAMLGYAVLTLVLGHGTSWWANILGGLTLALFWQQSGFLFHDMLHSGMSHRPNIDHTLGYVFSNVLFGLAGSWWKDDHDRHHAYVNEVFEDPQMTLIPLFATDEVELAKRGPAEERIILPPFFRFLLRYQAWFFIPMMVSLGQLQLHRLSSWYAGSRGQIVQLVGMAVYFCWLWYLVHALPGALHRVLFLGCAYLGVGVLHIQLFISHMDVPKYERPEAEHQQWAQAQITASRNISSAWWNEWFYGGLHYQIEHHLFPRLPRHNLSRVAPLVQALCKRHGLPYYSSGFFATLSGVLRSLARVSRYVDQEYVKDLARVPADKQDPQASLGESKLGSSGTDKAMDSPASRTRSRTPTRRSPAAKLVVPSSEIVESTASPVSGKSNVSTRHGLPVSITNSPSPLFDVAYVSFVFSYVASLVILA